MSKPVRVFITLLVTMAFMVNIAWGIVIPPEFVPLNQVLVPEPPQLPQFVKNKLAAIQLGKAFFWDMQVGSDGVQACASCHFHAGVDNRVKNTLNPGPGDTVFGNNPATGTIEFPGFGPNHTLAPATDLPLHQRGIPASVQSSPIIRDTNDVVGSQGVRLSDFTGLVFGSAVDSTVTLAPNHDPVFNIGGVNTRRVTGRNTPTMINAIFNFNNFWDGRAYFIFNGENPFGPAAQDGQNPTTAAGVWFNEATTLVKRPVSIEFASVASQAVGPAMDTTEMSGQGRTFPWLGRKMINNGLMPLGKQLVHPHDSVLGPLSAATLLPNGAVSGAKGLNTTYLQMIQAAFHDNLTSNVLTTPAGFKQIEANFSLFWGLAVQLYVATLVSDQTLFDTWLAGDADCLTPQQIEGFNLFIGIGNCSICHFGPEFTAATVASSGFVNNAIHGLHDLMFVADGTQVIYDIEYINTGVTPSAQHPSSLQTSFDLARGGDMPIPNPLIPGQNYPLSFVELGVLQAQNLLPPHFQVPILPPEIPASTPINTNGAFKAPGLRNVELTAPYFHNGSLMTLDEVMDFYARGGNFPLANAHDLDPILGAGLFLLQGPANEPKHEAIVAFLRSLTDPRVVSQSAPFDHPELFVPEGQDGAGQDIITRISATDASGNPAVAGLTLSPVTSPTRLSTQNISGTVEAGAEVQVSVNGGANVPATVTGTDWSASIAGLVPGDNAVTVSAIVGGAPAIVTATITVDTVGPALTVNPVVTPTRAATQTISGTVESGIVPVISVTAPTNASPVVVSGTNWSSLISNLVDGTNTINISAVDAAGNIATLSPVITVDTLPPILTINPVTTPTPVLTQTLSGTVETGATVQVSVNGGAWAPGTVTGTTWSFVASLIVGTNTISVIATDAAGNTTAATLVTATITVTRTGLTVTSPNGGDAWQQGTTHLIAWSYTGNPGTTVTIELFKGTQRVKKIAKKVPIGTGGNGAFNWTISRRQAVGADYQVKITVTQDPAITDSSDTFSITAPAAARR